MITKTIKLESRQTILVTGGYTGKKLHAARVGSSSLECGHWTKANISNFLVEDNVRPETLEKHSDHLCEKCFPEHAAAAQPKQEKPAYTGPKVHLNRAVLTRNNNGKLALGVRQGTFCARNNLNLYGIKFMEFKKVIEETPERVCSKCAKDYEFLKEQIRTAQARDRAQS
jgi:hypothetical protein